MADRAEARMKWMRDLVSILRTVHRDCLKNHRYLATVTAGGMMGKDDQQASRDIEDEGAGSKFHFKRVAHVPSKNHTKALRVDGEEVRKRSIF